MQPRIFTRAEHSISRTFINDNALKVLYRLKNAGFSAYLVGGSVRDLLLGQIPKDFDVATDAHPEEVRTLFRNCRLIGRRFRLAHVHFGRDIIEVATFRAGAAEAAGNNVYGTLEEDVWRRDFTVNALYYNIRDFSVVDYTGGVEDLERRLLRLIGEPEVRFREDAVRMLRAARFAAKLSFDIEEHTQAAMQGLQPLLGQIPQARLFDEVVKWFYCGASTQGFTLLFELGLFEQLFPEVMRVLNERHLSFLEKVFINTDARLAADKTVALTFMFACLLWPLVEYELEQSLKKIEREITPSDRLMALYHASAFVLRQQVRTVAIPRRITAAVREIWQLQMRLASRHPQRIKRVFAHPRFRAAYDFLLLRSEVEPSLQDLATWWTDYQAQS